MSDTFIAFLFLSCICFVCLFFFVFFFLVATCLVPRETAAVSAQVLCTPYSVTSFKHKSVGSMHVL